MNQQARKKVNWVITLALLTLALTMTVSAFGKDISQPNWGAELNRRVEECGQKIDRAYPPLRIPQSSLDLQTLSISQDQEVLVEVALIQPQEGVKEIFWTAKDPESAQAFIHRLKKGTFKSVLIERSPKKAQAILTNHKIFLLMGLALGKRDPKYDHTLQKIDQFFRNLNHCPTPHLIKIFAPCLRCPIKSVEQDPSLN